MISPEIGSSGGLGVRVRDESSFEIGDDCDTVQSMNPAADCEVMIADFNAFQKFLKGRTFKEAHGYYLFIGAGLPVGIAMGLSAGLTPLGDGGPWPMMLGFVAGVAWLYVTAIIYARILTRRLQPTSDGYMLTNQHYELRPEGFHVRTTKHEALFRWEGVAPPIDHREHYFVMVERSAAFVIPKRCFKNSEEAGIFAEKIRALAQHPPY